MKVIKSKSRDEVAQANIKGVKSFGMCDKQGTQCNWQGGESKRHCSLQKKLLNLMASRKRRGAIAHTQSSGNAGNELSAISMELFSSK